MTPHHKQVGACTLYITRGRHCAAQDAKNNMNPSEGLAESFLHWPLLPFVSWTIFLSGPYPHLTMIFKELKMEGFMQSRWEHKHPESLKKLMGWLTEVSLPSISQFMLLFFSVTDVINLFLYCRENYKVGSMSQKALKTCRLPSWGCCVEKTLAKLLSQSNVDWQREIHIINN